MRAYTSVVAIAVITRILGFMPEVLDTDIEMQLQSQCWTGFVGKQTATRQLFRIWRARAGLRASPL